MPARERVATPQRSAAGALEELKGPALGAPTRGERAPALPETSPSGSTAQWSTRLHLTAVVLAVLVPLLVFVGFLLWQVARSERDQLQKEALGLTDTLSASVDRELTGIVRALEVMAASPSFDLADPAGLYREALAAESILDSEIIVKSASGQQLANTLIGPSDPLPISLPPADKQAIASRKPSVSDLFLGAAHQRLIVSVNVPVIRNGEVVGLINAGLAPERVAAVLQQADLPADWIAAVVDRGNRILARSRKHEEFVGTLATEDLQENATGRRGVWVGFTAERMSVLGAYTRSAITGWRVAVGVPVAVLERPLYESVFWLVGIGAAVLALSSIVAGFLAQRLIAPMRALAVQAGQLGQGKAVQPTASTIAELSNVSAALERASVELRRRDSERLRAEAELRGSRARLERLLDTSPVGIVEVSPRGRFIFVNATAERLLQVTRTELEGRHYDEKGWVLSTPEGRVLTGRELPGAHALAGEQVIGTELEFLDPARDRRLMLSVNAAPVSGGGRVQSALITFGDVTERHRAEAALRGAQAELKALNESLEQRVADEIARRQETEEALRQSQKMEAIGQLTGGVAHDFNNLLTVILGNLENLGRRLPRDDERQRFVAAAERGAGRAALLTERLLAFSRRQPLAPSIVNVNELVAGMSELLQGTLGESISVRTALADELWASFVDSSQLENALINLAVNARDAMPDGGKLTITTANCRLDAAYAAHQNDLTAGEYVGISVGDTGCGMPADVTAKAFEPFFTTKDLGHGTGLGLSQVYGFIKQSGGHVRIDSEVGRGTIVRLYLPRHARPELDANEPAAARPVPLGLGEETILIVEDDPDVRTHTSEIVSDLGYRVLAAPDAHSALDLLNEHPEVRLLFTDVGLPGGVNGRQLAEQARRRRPDLPVLYATGYARDAIVDHGWLDPGVEVVFKPFTYSELAVTIRRVLET